MGQLHAIVTFDLTVRQERSSFSLTHVSLLLPGLSYLRTNPWKPCLSPLPFTCSRSLRLPLSATTRVQCVLRHFRLERCGGACSAPSPSASAWTCGPLRREALRCAQGTRAKRTSEVRCRQHSRGGACESSWYCCISCPIGKVRRILHQVLHHPLGSSSGHLGRPRTLPV